MKLVTAIIREERLDQVRQALASANIDRLTVSRVAGRGRQADENIHRGEKYMPSLLPKMRLDIAISDDLVTDVCNSIVRAAKSGSIGDGKIFITPLEQCVRIRTKESGTMAI